MLRLRDGGGEQPPEGTPERRREAVMAGFTFVVQVPARGEHTVEVQHSHLQGRAGWGGVGCGRNKGGSVEGEGAG